MSKTNYDYVAIVKAINNQLGGMYGYEFPVIDSDNFKAMAAAFVDMPMQIKNAYVDTLRNLMCNVAIKKVYTANNPFRKLYRDDTVLTGNGAQYIEEVAIDQFIPMAYEMSGNPEKFFKSMPPKVKVQILCNVVRKKYVVTLNSFVLEPAFQSLEAFDSFWSKTLDRLYADMEEDDKEEIIAAIDAIIEGGNMRIVTIARPVDSNTALNFSKTLDIVSRDLAFKRRRDYNVQHLSTKTAENEAVILVAGDVLATQNNFNLAWAFNRSFLEMDKNGQIIALDSDGLAGNKVFAVYTDTDFFRIHNVKGFPILKSWENGDNLEEKRWLHSWKMINFSYASNAIAFVAPEDVGVESVELLDADGNNAGTCSKGRFLQLALPKVTAATDKLADCFVTYSIAGASSATTRIDADGTLYVAEDETATEIVITGVSHLDSSKSGTYTVTVQ
jgi:hypothetical protein